MSEPGNGNTESNWRAECEAFHRERVGQDGQRTPGLHWEMGADDNRVGIIPRITFFLNRNLKTKQSKFLSVFSIKTILLHDNWGRSIRSAPLVYLLDNSAYIK